jgi:hypothetical protein
MALISRDLLEELGWEFEDDILEGDAVSTSYKKVSDGVYIIVTFWRNVPPVYIGRSGATVPLDNITTMERLSYLLELITVKEK